MGGLLEPMEEGLHCSAGSFHVDPWRPVPLAVVTHAHADRVVAGCGRYVASPGTAALIRSRLGPLAEVESRDWGEAWSEGGVKLSLHPSGHAFGAVQVRVEADEVWCVAGDVSLLTDGSCRAFETVPCDVLVIEAAYGLPVFRWPALEQIRADLSAWRDECGARGVAALLLAPALGLAQRLLAVAATAGDTPPLADASVAEVCQRVRDAGGPELPFELVPQRPQREALAGRLVVATPGARQRLRKGALATADVAMASGELCFGGARRRLALDRAFALSDHADWPALLEIVRRSGARRVHTTHAQAVVFARWLAERHGLAAEPWGAPWRAEADL